MYDVLLDLEQFFVVFMEGLLFQWSAAVNEVLQGMKCQD